jgi:hypothetical protein
MIEEEVEKITYILCLSFIVSSILPSCLSDRISY